MAVGSFAVQFLYLRYKSLSSIGRGATQAGAAIIEMALVLPLLLLLIGGVVDWSLALFANHTAARAILDGGRMLAMVRDFPEENEEPPYYADFLALTRERSMGVLEEDEIFVFPEKDIQATGMHGFRVSAVGDTNTHFLSLIGIRKLPVNFETVVFYERSGVNGSGMGRAVPPQPYLESLFESGGVSQEYEGYVDPGMNSFKMLITPPTFDPLPGFSGKGLGGGIINMDPNVGGSGDIIITPLP